MAIVFITIAVLGLVLTFWYSANKVIAKHQHRLTAACGQAATDVTQLYPTDDNRQVQVSNADLLQQQMQRVLAELSGAAGGFWHINSKFLGFSFDTYGLRDIQTDVPQAERMVLSSLSQRALTQEKIVSTVQRNQNNALVAVACPIPTHEGLTGWIVTRVSLIPLLYSVFSALLFAVIGVLAFMSLGRTIQFERRWYAERDRLIKQAEDDTKPVPVTSTINEIQPLLMLLYNARQTQINVERGVSSLQAKLGRQTELAVMARVSASLARELRARINGWVEKLRKAAQQQHESPNQDFEKLAQDIEQTKHFIRSFENLDLREQAVYGVEVVNVKTWLEEIIRYHQQFNARPEQALTAIVDTNLHLESHFLLLRYALDTLLTQAITFGPDNGEIVVKATEESGLLTFEVIDESKPLSSAVERRLFRQDDVLPETYGQGLKPVHEVIKSLGGEISYHSDGENSRFILQIPMTSE
ncbi:HAMP domain-containing histidine kinase [Idiomarina seosinensis]|uniref:sensor histidine kinase n=1 Tax=Idiomarina seosinensis TaxID=281739 RepID=UPI00384D87C9